MKKILNRILLALAASAVIILSLIVALVLIGKFTGKVPSYFGYSYLKIISGSMEPAIHTNTYIIIKKTDVKAIYVGDVITFYSRDPQIFGKPNTHRVIAVEEVDGKLYFTTKGDANPVKDELKTSEDDVIGKYECNADFFSAAGKLLSNPFVYLFLIFIPALLLFIYESVAFVKKLKDVTAQEKAERERKLIEAEIERLKQAEDGKKDD